MGCAGYIMQYLYQKEWEEEKKRVQMAEEKTSKLFTLTPLFVFNPQLQPVQTEKVKHT